jgi:mRNA deadenylase 3'-5' endonuclease subunit Ccr4
MCLQEVQGDHFENFFQPRLAAHGFDGVFKPKTRDALGDNPNAVDGCAIFFRRDRFALIEQYVPDSPASFSVSCVFGSLIDCNQPFLLYLMVCRYSIEFNEAARQHTERNPNVSDKKGALRRLLKVRVLLMSALNFGGVSLVCFFALMMSQHYQALELP